MRGKATSYAKAAALCRITPAYAGKRDGIDHAFQLFQDHPRVCGEKQAIPDDYTAQEGSPPRMRGKGIQQCYARLTVGITPAYAGKSILRCCSRLLSGDHPRVCGEKKFKEWQRRQKEGSPPRMRGKEGDDKGED